MSKEHDLINNGRANTVSVINLILLVAVLVLGVGGYFVPESTGGEGAAGATKAEVQKIVEDALEDLPTAAPAPAAAPQPAAPTPPPAPTEISLDELEKGLEGTYVKGNEDAKVTVIEFSDFECPFCKRHDNQGTTEQVLEKYGDDVNAIFMHFPLSFHPLAQKAQEGAECVGEQGGAEAFYAYKKGIFGEAKPTRDAIKKVVEGLEGVDAEAVETCIDSGKYAQKVTDAMNFGRKLGVTGTPGSIVVNNESGEFTKVSGAVPASAFDAAITSYLE